MRSTMPDFPLTVGQIFDHGRLTYADSEVVTAEQDDGVRRITFEALAERAERLAAGLDRLGVRAGDRVATFGWNRQEHEEAYFAVPCMGAVLHTLNIRLFPEQLAYIIEHARDKVLLLDASLAGALAPVLETVATLEHVIVFGDGDRSQLDSAIEYEDMLAAEEPGYQWPAVQESDAAAMCYTSGTTGSPKGVVYSHRSTFLHSLGVCSGEALGLRQEDRILPVVPMFHGNAWGLPYAGWLVGADLLLPSRFAQARQIVQMIAQERATLAAAVPTVWHDVLALGGDDLGAALSSLRMVMCGGAAVPRTLIEAYQERYGVPMVQGWGMTETSPVASLAFPPKREAAERGLDYRATAGRPLGGVDARIVDEDGTVLPRDGAAVGELEVRGPWVTTSYYRDPAPDKFHDGWLRTGDVGSIDAHGYITIKDRSKDVIKSGGEWIPSLDLESELLAHPAVREVAVIAATDDRWGERPLACVVFADGADATADELRAFLEGRVAKWWIPERWTFVNEIPRTGVGKHDKKALRAAHAEGELDLILSEAAAGSAPAAMTRK
jgi:fatty-acyl-CoA synthase